MAVVFQASGSVVIHEPGDLIKQLRDVGYILNAVMADTIANIAKMGEDTYKARIMSNAFNLRPLAETTIRTRIRGKLAGTTLAKPKRPGRLPLLYTGRTGNSFSQKSQSATQIVLGFSGGNIRYGSGASVAGIAAVHETGSSPRIRYTARMLRYLHVLFSRPGSRGARGREDETRRARRTVRVGVSVVHRIPIRPAVGRTAKIMQIRTPKELMRAVREVQRRSKLHFQTR
jgi:hypothetical protein